MAIGILQLSDIHIKTCDNPVLGRLSHIKNAVQSVAHDISELLLVVTGDIAYSGKQDEYVLAAAFLDSLRTELQRLPDVRFLGTAIIPGNHDCDFGRQGSVRTLLINSSARTPDGTGRAPEDFESQMLQVQGAFFDFEALISDQPTLKDRLFWTRRFKAGCGNVSVRCLNTAWLSQLEETPTLHFPVPIVAGNTDDSDLVLTLFHHPYNWLEPENARALRRAVETTSDLVFTGHEHDGEAYTRTNPGTTTANYVEGAALQAAGIETGFNFAKVDLEAGTYDVHQFRWAEDMYRVVQVSSAPFTRNQALLEHRFINNQEFTATLSDPGTPFSHPVKGNLLELKDLFVYPDLRLTGLQAVPDRTLTTIQGHDVLSFVFRRKKIVITGPPTSGRTSLAKTLYAGLQHTHKLVPVFLTGTAFKGVECSKVTTAINRAFEGQYSSKLVQKFTQLERQSKVAIIDDWHRVKFNLKGKASILAVLEKLFERVVLISDDAPIFRQPAEIEEFSSFAEFESCEIQQFGRRLRGELILRWHSLGRELEVDEAELTNSVNASENLLDTLTDRGVFPSFPVYVLSVLQASDRIVGHNVPYGSYGHIYESLLTRRMARVNKKDLGQKYTYLSTIAYRMFTSGKSALGQEDLKELHDEYRRAYLYSVDQETFLNELFLSQILSRSADGISFQHRFSYYFFVAKYFQIGMEDGGAAPVLSEQLRKLADEAYEDENARVLIFYLYLVKDRLLIEHILTNAERIFCDYAPCDLNKDVDFVNALYCARPTLEAPSLDVRKNRQEFRRQQDEASREEEPRSVERSPDSLQIDLSFESLQIMGQVLRNFPGSLKGDLKVRLAQHSYLLAFRTLKKFLCDTEKNLVLFQDVILKHLRHEARFARREIEDVKRAADKLIIGLSEVMIFAVIKKLSLSVGLEELRDVYSAVRNEAGEGHLPTRLTDLCISLDHFGRLPLADVRDLERRVRDNIVVHTILRLLVAQHMALFPVKYQLRQNMVQLFNLNPRPLLLAEKNAQQNRAYF